MRQYTDVDAGLLHALRAKMGKLFPKNHEACEWCVKKRRMCASIRAGAEGELPFVSFLPLSSSLRGALARTTSGIGELRDYLLPASLGFLASFMVTSCQLRWYFLLV